MSLKENAVRLRRFGAILASTSRNAHALVRADKSKEGLSREFTHFVMKRWADEVLGILRVKIQTTGVPSKEPCLFLGNHMSYMDIPLLMGEAQVVFIAKKELASWPFFGHAMRSVGTVFVDRGSVHSRKSAADAVAPYIREQKQSVAIFPSGTTKLLEDSEWRWGAFLIAKRYGIPVQPFRLVYRPARAAAFIAEDSFAPHLWNLLGTPNLTAEIEFAPPLLVDDPETEARRWWSWAREKVNSAIN